MPIGGKGGLKCACRHLVDRHPTSDHADQQVRNDQADQDRKQQHADAVAFEPVAKELDLGRVSVPATEAPQLDADQKKAERVDDAARRGKHPVNAHAFPERLAGRTDQREGGHRRAEQRHQQ